MQNDTTTIPNHIEPNKTDIKYELKESPQFEYGMQCVIIA